MLLAKDFLLRQTRLETNVASYLSYLMPVLLQQKLFPQKVFVIEEALIALFEEIQSEVKKNLNQFNKNALSMSWINGLNKSSCVQVTG